MSSHLLAIGGFAAGSNLEGRRGARQISHGLRESARWSVRMATAAFADQTGDDVVGEDSPPRFEAINLEAMEAGYRLGMDAK